MIRVRARGLLLAAACVLLVLAAVGWPEAGEAAAPEHVVLLDLSRSHGTSIPSLVSTLGRRLEASPPGEGRICLVGFGTRAEVLVPPRSAGSLEEVLGEAQRRAATLPPGLMEGSHLAMGLAAALRLTDPARPLEISIHGDGRYPRSALEPALDALHARGGRMTFAGRLVPEPRDLRLEPGGPVPPLEPGRPAVLPVRVLGAVEAPRRVRVEALGAAAEILVGPGSPGVARLRVVPGAQARHLEIRITDPGGADAYPGNNTLRLPVVPRGARQVGVFGDRAQEAGAALRAAGFAVDTGGAAELPRDDQERWEALVLANAPALEGGLDRQALASLRAAVSGSGTGLVVLGGDRAFAAGGYGLRNLEAWDAFLPLGSHPGGRRHLLVLLDRSGSMEQGARLRRAVAALMRLAARLEAAERVQVLPFAASPGAPVPPVPGPPEVLGRAGGRDLLRLPPSGGTRLAPALERAAELLGKVGTERQKVLLVLSDLQDPEAGPATLEALRQVLADRDVEVVVALLDPVPETRARADALTTRVLEVPRVTPDVLVEAVEGRGWVRRELVVDRAAPPGGGARGRELRAWNPVRAQEGARVWLRAGEGRPLGARVRRGAGQVLALATDPFLEAWLSGLLPRMVEAVLPPAPGEVRAWWEEGRLRFHWNRTPEPVAVEAQGHAAPVQEVAPGLWESGALEATPPVLLLRGGRDALLARLRPPPAGDPEHLLPPGHLEMRSLQSPPQGPRLRLRWPFAAGALGLMGLLLLLRPRSS